GGRTRPMPSANKSNHQSDKNKRPSHRHAPPSIPRPQLRMVLKGIIRSHRSGGSWNPVAGCTVLTAGCTNCYNMENVMGSMISLAVGRFEIEWGKNNGFVDHSALF